MDERVWITISYYYELCTYFKSILIILFFSDGTEDISPLEMFQAMTSVKSTSSYIISFRCFRSSSLQRTPSNSIIPNLQEQETGKRIKLPNAELHPDYAIF